MFEAQWNVVTMVCQCKSLGSRDANEDGRLLCRYIFAHTMKPFTTTLSQSLPHVLSFPENSVLPKNRFSFVHACPQPVSGGIVYIKYCICKIRHLVLCTTTTTDGRQYLLNIFCMSMETDRLSTSMVEREGEFICRKMFNAQDMNPPCTIQGSINLQ